LLRTTVDLVVLYSFAGGVIAAGRPSIAARPAI
jgi:hypothetical protein